MSADTYMKSKTKRHQTFAKRGAADVEEAKAWLANQNIEEIECLIPDLAGVARGKIMPSKKFLNAPYMNLPLAVFYQTITGDYPELDGIVDAVQADTDIFLRPDFRTLSAVPWAHDPTAQWDGEVFRDKVPGPHFDAGLAGSVLHSTADVVSSAAELARLTLNIAATHHDSRINHRRQVYGGHTIGLAFAQASRLLPNLVTVLNWQSCDHTGPVHEGDTLYSELHIESAEPTDGGGVLGLRSLVYAFSDLQDEPRQVLDWRFTALQF